MLPQLRPGKRARADGEDDVRGTTTLKTVYVYFSLSVCVSFICFGLFKKYLLGLYVTVCTSEIIKKKYRTEPSLFSKSILAFWLKCFLFFFNVYSE